jgi:hypothetical protein
MISEDETGLQLLQLPSTVLVSSTRAEHSAAVATLGPASSCRYFRSHPFCQQLHHISMYAIRRWRFLTAWAMLARWCVLQVPARHSGPSLPVHSFARYGLLVLQLLCEIFCAGTVSDAAFLCVYILASSAGVSHVLQLSSTWTQHSSTWMLQFLTLPDFALHRSQLSPLDASIQSYSTACPR